MKRKFSEQLCLIYIIVFSTGPCKPTNNLFSLKIWHCMLSTCHIPRFKCIVNIGFLYCFCHLLHAKFLIMTDAMQMTKWCKEFLKYKLLALSLPNTFFPTLFSHSPCRAFSFSEIISGTCATVSKRYRFYFTTVSIPNQRALRQNLPCPISPQLKAICTGKMVTGNH